MMTLFRAWERKQLLVDGLILLTLMALPAAIVVLATYLDR